MLSPAQVLVDGRRRLAGLKLPQTPVVEGDRLLRPSPQRQSSLKSVVIEWWKNCVKSIRVMGLSSTRATVR